MSPIERLEAVLAGRQPDRPPVSFWHHFPQDQVHGPAAIAAHITHAQTYDLDFLKVMNDNPYPHTGVVEKLADLRALTVLRGNEEGFARQLDLIAGLKRALGSRLLMSTTVFNAWATLRHLVRPPKEHNPPVMNAHGDGPSATIRSLFAENPQAVRTALANIGASLANFATRCLDAGADGIYLSVRDDWVDSPAEPKGLYADLVRPSDMEILSAASAGTFNILHICGKAVDFAMLASYPVHVLSWADRAAGPSIASVRTWLKPAICAGVDNLTTLPNGTPADVQNEVHDAIRQAAGRPIIIAPGCTYDPKRVPSANLHALRQAAELVEN